MIRAAILGSPVHHSLSPLIHKRAYAELGLDGFYEKFEIEVLDFPQFIDQALEDNWTGFSLTMPLKEIAFESSFECDARSKMIYSANTLIRFGDTFKATSTDVSAFDRLLERISYSKVAVIGGGGTARAALGALDGLVETVSVVQRSSKRNELLSSCLTASKIEFLSYESNLSDFDLVISTTPQGASDRFAHSIPQNPGILIEALYKPLPTVLSAAWKAQGGVVVDGLDLLVEQALDQISLFTNVSFDYTSMRELLLAEVRSYISQL